MRLKWIICQTIRLKWIICQTITLKWIICQTQVSHLSDHHTQVSHLQLVGVVGDNFSITMSSFTMHLIQYVCSNNSVEKGLSVVLSVCDWPLSVSHWVFSLFKKTTKLRALRLLLIMMCWVSKQIQTWRHHITISLNISHSFFLSWTEFR